MFLTFFCAGVIVAAGLFLWRELIWPPIETAIISTKWWQRRQDRKALRRPRKTEGYYE